jgi:hypothetical protein
VFSITVIILYFSVHHSHCTVIVHSTLIDMVDRTSINEWLHMNWYDFLNDPTLV